MTIRILLLLCLIGLNAPLANAADPWVAGQHYYVLQPAQPTDVPKGKLQLTEIFSYGCPACNAFAPTMRKLVKSLPANVVVEYVPASWSKGEDWPMFQRAYLAAKALGVADRVHDQMFVAIWGGGELSITDPATHGIKTALPTIDDAARFYQRSAGVPAARFLQAAQSFGVEAAIQISDRRIRAVQAEYTPTLIVNGKYRVDQASAGGFDKLVEVARWLVDRELGKAH